MFMVCWKIDELTFGAMAPSMLRYLKPYFGEIDLPVLKYSHSYRRSFAC